MLTSIEQLADESVRQFAFPVCRSGVFFAHAGVTALPRCTADAIIDYTRQSTEAHQEFGDVLRRIQEVRQTCAEVIGAEAREIALLGPTSLGLSLFANGLPWREGDEIVGYQDDYPANVYPWRNLEQNGVRFVGLEPERPGEITPELVAAALTPRTRLVALASCHFLTGYRIDVAAIGKVVHEHGALFSLDAIQTIGAFETRVDHVDFLSADAHKWMLGPMVAGIVFVKASHFELLRPSLLGAWNVRSPNFIAAEQLDFVATAQRYEPGVLNCAGLFGMDASLRMIQGIGQSRVSARLLQLKAHLVNELQERNYQIYGPAEGPHASSITTCYRPGMNLEALSQFLTRKGVSLSLRHNRERQTLLRFSPHFYNTLEECDRVLAWMDEFDAENA